MFQIFADGATIYDSRYDEYSISQGSINLEVNKSGSLVFGLYSDHPYYDRIEKLSTIITVYRDNKLIYRGRVIKTVDGFYGDKVFTCEGELSFLLDSIQRAWSFTGTPEELFTQFINNHNAQVAADKQFTIGRVTVTDPNDYITRANSSYEDTLTNLNSKLLETLGGYIDITTGENGARVISWLADYPYLSTQSIQFGENLLDFTKTNNAEDLATALIPLGAKIDTQDSDVEQEPRVTIASVNDGLDYIYNQEAVNKYGWIYKSIIWDDVTVPANLLTKARAYLNESINLNISLELSAIDLSAMDQDISAFMLGDYIQVVSPPHGIDAKYLLTKQTIDILHPENDTVTLGYTFATFTDTTLSNSGIGSNLTQKVETIENNYVTNGAISDEIRSLKSMIEQTADSITMGVLQEYATNDQVTEAVGTLYTQLKDTFEFAFTTIETSINESDANTRQEFEEIRKYIRFEDGDIILGQSDNELRLRIESDRITFFDGVTEVAYISNHKLHITEAEVLESIIIGNYAFIPRANGNLSFKKVR